MVFTRKTVNIVNMRGSFYEQFRIIYVDNEHPKIALDDSESHELTFTLVTS